MPDESGNPPGLPIRRVLLDLSPPKTAHGFSWSRVDDQFMLEVGYFDLKSMSDVIVKRQRGEETAESEGIDLFITDRFVMNFASVERLLELMKTLKAEYDKQVAAHVD